MSKAYIITNAVTAFTISSGTALGVVLVGGKPTAWQVVAAVVAGLVVAAKDTRSLLKLPPVEDSTTNNQNQK
jgi:hypothetical protein